MVWIDRQTAERTRLAGIRQGAGAAPRDEEPGEAMSRTGAPVSASDEYYRCNPPYSSTLRGVISRVCAALKASTVSRSFKMK
jgi:hypothetical protein